MLDLQINKKKVKLQCDKQYTKQAYPPPPHFFSHSLSLWIQGKMITALKTPHATHKTATLTCPV